MEDNSMKVHDHYCCLLIVHGVIMTNEGQLGLHEDKSGNADTLITFCHQNSKSHHHAVTFSAQEATR